MGILDRIRQIFLPAAQAEKTSLAETREPAQPASLAAVFSADYDRVAVIKKAREIYKSDPRGKRMVKRLAADIVRGGVVVQADNPRAQEEAEALLERLNLDMRLDDWTRLSIRDGDSFLELGVDGEMNISEVSRKPTTQMHRNSNRYDKFDDPQYAFYWVDDLYILQAPKKDDPAAVWFAQWQIIHARWEHDEGNKYGTPMLEAGLAHYKKVSEGELDVAIRRKTRAGMKYLHVIEDGDEGDIEAYRELNQDALDNPFAAVADFFTSKAGSIQAIQGDANLNQLDDVKHMIATWMQTGDTPMELLGYGEDLNRDVLGEKKIEYEKMLDQMRAWVRDQLIKPLLERQWLLKGIWPDMVKYQIIWKAKKEVTPEMVMMAAQAAAQLKILGVREEIIAQMLAKWLPDVDSADLFAAREPDAASAGRINRVVNDLGDDEDGEDGDEDQ